MRMSNWMTSLYSSKDRERRESEMEEGTGESDDGEEIHEDEQLDDKFVQQQGQGEERK